MRKLLIVLLSCLPLSVMAAGGPSVPLDKANYDLRDQASLQNGARLFMNYCLGCHQTQYQTYQRIFEDLGIPKDLGEEFLMFTAEKPSEYVLNGMDADAGAKWFGKLPPDLTLVARVRGADWIYTFLRSYYVDETKTFGVNNKVFADVGMPHVLEELQGTPRETWEPRMVDGQMKDIYVGLKSDGNGELSTDEYNQAVLDLTNFLVYSGEPTRLERESLGAWVLGFILVFGIFAYLLKKEYWRDVH